MGAIFKRRRKLTHELRCFFGREPYELPIASREFSSVDLPNLQLAIEAYRQDHKAQLQTVGYTGGISGLPSDLGDMIGKDGWLDSVRIGPVQYRMVDIDVDRRMQCV